MQRRPLIVLLVPLLLLGSLAPASVASAHPYRAPDLTLAMLAPRVTGVPPLPACAYKDIKTRFLSRKSWRKTLVDTRLRVGSKYKPSDLISVANANIGGSGRVRQVMIDDLRAMARAARNAGKGVAVRSAFRSYSEQQAVFNGWVAKSGYQQALKYSARPGHSEHQLGTTIDFRSASSQAAPWDYNDWATSGPGKWMKNHAWEFGFVMSYPKGTFSKVCYGYEPWHYRYFGRALAKRIHESGLTPREYLWRHFESQE